MLVSKKTTHFPENEVKEKALRMSHITSVIEIEIFSKAIHQSQMILNLKQRIAINMKIQILATLLRGSADAVTGTRHIFPCASTSQPSQSRLTQRN